MPKAHALHSAAHCVAEKIGPLEAAIDQSLTQAASLLAYLPEARMAAGLPISTGHDAIVNLLASLNSIARARTKMIDAHAALAQTGAELRIPATGFGSLAGCPTATHLQLVDSEAA